MRFLHLLLTAASIREWQGAHASSGEIVVESSFDKASQITCQAFEDEHNIVKTTTPSMRIRVDWGMPGAEKLGANRKVMLQAVKTDGSALKWASAELQNDRQVVLEAVKESGSALEWASKELQNDRDIVLAGLRRYGSLEHASKELQSDRQIVLEAVNHTPMSLKYASAELKSDRQIVREAMNKTGSALQWASEELKSDRQFVLEAVKRDGAALNGASEELKADREIVLAAVQNSERWHDVLRLASTELKADRQVVLEAVKRSGYSLHSASEELQNDRLIVLEAVKQDAWALRYASKELRADRQIVLEALKQKHGSYVFMWASEELKADRQIALEAVKTDGWFFCDAAKELHNDRELLLEAVKSCGHALRCASEELKSDRQIVLEAIKEDGHALIYASEELRKDRQLVLEATKSEGHLLCWASEFNDDWEIVLNAVAQDRLGYVLRCASDRLRADRQIVLQALNTSRDYLLLSSYGTYALRYASKNLTEDQDFLLEAVKLIPRLIEVRNEGLDFLQGPEVCYLPYPVLPEEYRCDPEIADLAMKKDGLFLEDACADLRANRSLQIAAVEQNVEALRYASQALQGDLEGSWELAAMAAAQGKARQFCNATIELHGEREHALRALQIDGMLLQCASPELKADEELALAAVKQSGCALEFSAQRWRSDPDFVHQALARNGLAFIYASERLQCDSDMQRSALRSSGWHWLLSKLRNSTSRSAHSSAVPTDCIKVGEEEEPNQTASFVAGGIEPHCLAAVWPILSDGPLICDKTPTSSSSSFAPVLLCVAMGGFLLVITAAMAIWRRAMMRRLTLLGSKDDHDQYHGVDLEGLINRQPGATCHDNGQHRENTTPP